MTIDAMESHQPVVNQLIGVGITKQRERAGLTRLDLAQRVAVSGFDIAAIETGARRANASLLLDIANALAVPITELMIVSEY